MVTEHPVFEVEGGRLTGRLSRYQVENGQALAGVPLDAAGEAALEALDDGHEPRPEMTVDFHFEAGQIQFLHNRRIAHKRSGVPRLAGARAQAPSGAPLAPRPRPRVLQRVGRRPREPGTIERHAAAAAGRAPAMTLALANGNVIDCVRPGVSPGVSRRRSRTGASRM